MPNRRIRASRPFVAFLLPMIVGTFLLLNPNTLPGHDARQRGQGGQGESAAPAAAEPVAPWLELTHAEASIEPASPEEPIPTVFAYRQGRDGLEIDHARLHAAAEASEPAAQAQPRTRTMRMRVTAYCPCPHCCGEWADGITASGHSIRHNQSRFVAADTSLLPFGTRLSIPGYAGGEPVPVLDRGGAIKGNRLDVFFPTHQEALEWGVQELDVVIHLD